MVKNMKEFFTRGIWSKPLAELHGAKKIGIIALRAVISTVQGIIKNRIAVQASSLSYATLLAIGPILAITILFSSMFFRDKGEDFIYEKIMDATVFVMPAMNEMMQNESLFDDGQNTDNSQKSATAQEGKNKNSEISNGATALQPQQAIASDSKKMKINPKVMEFINKISRGSSTAGSVGIIAMLFTCLLLCINMESSLNFIWNAKKGRNWINRIVFYFAMIFFGTVGTMFAMTFLATSQLSSMLSDIPLISKYASWVTYILGMGAMTCVLASFYKFIPCAEVRWLPAFSGAFVGIGLLLLNNKLSFLYISYIAKQQNFYGYFAIVAVAMFSLYIFWFVILAGGQISYVVQYLDFISDDEDWNETGLRTRSLIELAVYSQVAKAFYGECSVPTLGNISAKLRLSESLAKSSLDSLVEKKIVCRCEPEDSGEILYKPEFSPDTITVGEFLDRIGANANDAAIRGAIIRESAAVLKVTEALEEFNSTGVCSKSIKDIL